MGEADSRVFTHAKKNGGVITRAEALALGMSARSLSRRISDGVLTRLGPGLLGLPGVTTSERSLLRAATSALDAVASHESAARLHKLDGLNWNRVVVSVPVRRSNRFRGVYVHQLTDLRPEHTTRIDGIALTKPARTIVDLAAVLQPKLLSSVADQAVRRRLTDHEEIARLLQSLARKGKPGVKKLRSYLESRMGKNHVSDSALESRLYDLIVTSDLPVPSSQFQPAWLRRVNGRVDLAYVEHRLVIEGDSQRWHGDPYAFQMDRRRDNLAQLAGWRILRFTWEDITTRPEYVVDTVARALRL